MPAASRKKRGQPRRAPHSITPSSHESDCEAKRARQRERARVSLREGKRLCSVPGGTATRQSPYSTGGLCFRLRDEPGMDGIIAFESRLAISFRCIRVQIRSQGWRRLPRAAAKFALTRSFHLSRFATAPFYVPYRHRVRSSPRQSFSRFGRPSPPTVRGRRLLPLHLPASFVGAARRHRFLRAFGIFMRPQSQKQLL